LDHLVSAVPHKAPNRENLAGLVERVTFHNEDSGFCVLRVKARGQRDLITIVGHAAAIGAGEFVQASGRWVNDRTHGVRFAPISARCATDDCRGHQEVPRSASRPGDRAPPPASSDQPLAGGTVHPLVGNLARPFLEVRLERRPVVEAAAVIAFFLT
jgi:hypothetical protein